MGMFDYLKSEVPTPLPGSEFVEQKRPKRRGLWLCGSTSKSEPGAQSLDAQPLVICTRALPKQSAQDEYRLDVSASDDHLPT